MRPSYKPPKQTPIEARKIARFYVGASLEDVFEAVALEWLTSKSSNGAQLISVALSSKWGAIFFRDRAAAS